MVYNLPHNMPRRWWRMAWGVYLIVLNHKWEGSFTDITVVYVVHQKKLQQYMFFWMDVGIFHQNFLIGGPRIASGRKHCPFHCGWALTLSWMDLVQLLWVCLILSSHSEHNLIWTSRLLVLCQWVLNQRCVGGLVLEF